MYLDRTLMALVASSSLLGASACSSSSETAPPTGTDGASDGTSGTDGTDGSDGTSTADGTDATDGTDGLDATEDPGVVASLTGGLKARSGQVLATDLSVALDLPRESVCAELGLYDCATNVHRIALGGMEPYELGIRSPLPVAPATAPIAVERLALAACTERARLDFEAPSTGVFAPLVATDDPPTTEVLRAVSTTLFQKLVRRTPSDAELTELVDFHAELVKDGGHTRDWAVGACVALATHVETLFY